MSTLPGNAPGTQKFGQERIECAFQLSPRQFSGQEQASIRGETGTERAAGDVTKKSLLRKLRTTD